jgi:Tol biopolymer transport system component
MDADGSNKRPLKKLPYEAPNSLYGSEPDWSPDGKKIAYQFCTNCEAFGSNYEIAIAEVEGEEYDSTQIHTVTSYSGSDTYPKWSPDGSRIAFQSDRNYPEEGGTDLYVMNADGSNQQLTNFGKNILTGGISWYPNGKKIYFSAGGANSYGLYFYNFKAGAITVLKLEMKGLHPLKWSKNRKYLLLIN